VCVAVSLWLTRKNGNTSAEKESPTFRQGFQSQTIHGDFDYLPILIRLPITRTPLYEIIFDLGQSVYVFIQHLLCVVCVIGLKILNPENERERKLLRVHASPAILAKELTEVANLGHLLGLCDILTG
jgi:hypothetical protein